VERSSIQASADDLGLSLAEGKLILREIQRSLLQDQVEEISEVARVCRSCGAYLPVHDRRQRRIDTLFGRVTGEVPRVRMCLCGLPGFPEFKAVLSQSFGVWLGPAGCARSGPLFLKASDWL